MGSGLDMIVTEIFDTLDPTGVWLIGFDEDDRSLQEQALMLWLIVIQKYLSNRGIQRR